MAWGNVRPKRALTQRQRRQIFERDNYQCQIRTDKCTGVADCIDHILALSAGGTDDPSNLRASCRKCNQVKAGYEGRAAQGLIKVKRPTPPNPGLAGQEHVALPESPWIVREREQAEARRIEWQKRAAEESENLRRLAAEFDKD